ncbi:MAG: H-NS histone family protein [Pseudomonadota bacterium]
MSKRPTKASSKAVSYEDMPLKDLLGMEVQIKKAIAVAKERERNALKQQIEAMAQDSGFSVGELFSGRSTKGKTVAPKYMNPDNRTETWTGRGRKPRWLVAKLDEGASLDDFAI